MKSPGNRSRLRRTFGGHAIELRQVGIEEDVLAAHRPDERFDLVHQNDLFSVTHLMPPLVQHGRTITW